MNRLTLWNKKLWVRLHRKPSSPLVIYISVVVTGFIAGVFMLVGMIGIVTLTWQLAAAGIGLMLVFGWSGYVSDKKLGFVHAMHEAYLMHRRKVAREVEEAERKTD